MPLWFTGHPNADTFTFTHSVGFNLSCDSQALTSHVTMITAPVMLPDTVLLYG